MRGGAATVFADISPGTLNLDETKVEAAITPRVGAIIGVHDPGFGCEMNALQDMTQRHGLLLLEHAAHGECRRRRSVRWISMSNDDIAQVTMKASETRA